MLLAALVSACRLILILHIITVYSLCLRGEKTGQVKLDCLAHVVKSQVKSVVRAPQLCHDAIRHHLVVPVSLVFPKRFVMFLKTYCILDISS